jgi:hypothetical protein
MVADGVGGLLLRASAQCRFLATYRRIGKSPTRYLDILESRMKQNVVDFNYSHASIVLLPARGSRFVVAVAAAAENQSEAQSNPSKCCLALLLALSQSH